MKWWLFILLALPVQLYGQAFSCTDKNGNPCSSGLHPFTFITTTGNLSDVQATVNDASCIDGDTIRIGPQPGPTVQFIYTWAGSWTNVVGPTPKIVKLLGWGKHKTKIQRGDSTTPGIVHYTCKDKDAGGAPLHLIAEVGGFELANGQIPSGGGQWLNQSGSKRNLWVDGVATVKRNNAATTTGGYDGGIKIHDILFSSDPETPLGGGPNTHYAVNGWIFGVMYHCEMYDNIYTGGPTTSGNTPMLGEIGSFMASTSPDGTGNYGDYVTNFPPGGVELAGTKDVFYIEDCIWHHGGGYADSNSSGAGGPYGGAIRCDRHLSSWAQFAVHGSREGGSREHNARLVEQYNNLKLQLHDPAVGSYPGTKVYHDGQDTNEGRDGEYIGYNNYLANLSTNGKVFGSNCDWCSLAIMGADSIADDRWLWSADGVNPWDNNQRGSFDMTPPSGNNPMYHHDVDAVYTYSNPATGTNVVGGLDQDPYHRLGDVYGHVIGTFTAPTNGDTITGITIQATNAGGTPTSIFPKDYWRGFVIRNADKPRSQKTPMCYMYIIGSTPTPTGGGPISLTLLPSNGNNTLHPNLDPTPGASGSHFELRRVIQIFNVGKPAQSAKPIILDSAGNPCIQLTEPKIYWHDPTLGAGSEQQSRFLVWGNQYAIATTQTGTYTWKPETPAINTTVTQAAEFITPGFHQSLKSADQVTFGAVPPNDIPLNTDSSNQYPISPGTLAGSGSGYGGPTTTGNVGAEENEATAPLTNVRPETRVGADFIGSYPRPSFIGAAGSNFYPGSDTNTGIWGSFFAKGSGGFTYPHPLRGVNITNSAPAFTSPTDNNTVSLMWTAGQINSFTVTTTGFPVPTIAKTGGASLPSWMSFTDNGDGTANFKSTASATHTGSPFGAFTLTASNTAGSKTQSVSIYVQDVVTVSLSCSLVAPTDGTIADSGSTIPLEAQAVPSTGHSILNVKFYQSTSLPTYTLIGTGTFDSTSQSYKLDTAHPPAWTPANGTYTVKATVTEQTTNATADSDTAGVTLRPPPTPTPTPSPAIIFMKP